MRARRVRRVAPTRVHAPGPDLQRILGYVPPSDVLADSESDGEGGDAAAAEAVNPASAADAVVDREWVKMRAAKLTMRHNARGLAAAAQGQSAGR
jgi:hypothetical protein